MRTIGLKWTLRLMTAFFTMVLSAQGVVAQTILVRYVDAAAPSGGDGMSWSTAYNSLTSALSNANPSESEVYQLWVAAGTYKPTDGTDRTVSFGMKSRVEMYGGFDGTESALEERDWETNVTILSGDIGTTGVSTDNSYHVVKAEGVNQTALIDGFVIRDGYADNFGNGAGLLIIPSFIPTTRPSSPRVFNCVFENNVARFPASAIGSGGAVYSSSGQMETANTLLFGNCVFRDNLAGHDGGAVSVSGANEVVFNSCSFIDNSVIPADQLALALGGGAINVSGSALRTLTMQECIFKGNHTPRGEGGAAYISFVTVEARRCDFIENTSTGRGGGIFLTTAALTKLVECRFISNESVAFGGGLAITSPVEGATGPIHVVNCQFLDNAVSPASGGLGGGFAHNRISDGVNVTNTLFAGNLAHSGGAVHGSRKPDDDEPVIFTNCTIAHNVATGPGQAGGLNVSNEFWVRNSILWENTSDNEGGTSAQIRVDAQNVVTYSCVEGGFTGTGNIDADPLFVDSGHEDVTQRNYRPEPCSPATDAANYSVIPDDEFDVNENMIVSELTPDLDRQERAVDNPFRTPTGVGNPDVPDMGAYELNVLGCDLPGDLNNDASFDGLDIAPFVECLLGASQSCGCADVNLSGAVDILDVFCFVQMLLTGEPCDEMDCEAGLRFFVDCNDNGVHDAHDIFYGTSTDCNGNGIPDECEIDENSSAPGGPYYCQQDCAQDVNDNGIPDECEPDCNKNGIPDDWDIAQATSADVNGNGIPDECETDCNNNGVPDDYDILIGTSADCNDNGIPDECEPDCNGNGVPDDCDIDPSDPDGDEWVSPDCNDNGLPDECDLSLPPPFGSFDCNENGIPDECDIASGYSEDENENGIPDECEGESFMMGGEGGGEGGGESAMMSGDGMDGSSLDDSFDEDAAWEAYYDWARGQCWGSNCETTGGEQFRAAMQKKLELGLPPDRDW